MRQSIQATFQGLTKNPKFTPEFLNLLFLVSLFQITVFAHHYQYSFKNNFSRETYEVQDQGLQMGHIKDVTIKRIYPFSYMYLKTSGNGFQTKLQKVSGSLDTFSRMCAKSLDHPKALEITLKSLPRAQLNIINPLNNNGNYIVENLLFLTNSQDLIFEISPLFSGTNTSFLTRNEYNLPSQDPDPFNSTPFSASTFETQKHQVEKSLEPFLEEQEAKGYLTAPSTRHVEIELKSNSFKNVLGEVSTSRNESITNLSVPSVSEAASVKKPEPKFKAFHHYKIDTKNRLLNFWMQCTAPSENVPAEEIPYRNALIKLLLSDKYQHLVTEANWLSDPEDDEETNLMLSQRREEAFYNYLRSINWAETEFKALFHCPQILGEEDFHQAKEDAFEYAYKLLGRCAPDFCRDEDFRVRNGR